MDRPSRFAALRSPIALVSFLFTVAEGLSLDQWSKVAAFKRLCSGVQMLDGRAYVQDAHSYAFLPGWLEFTAVANQGAVFGLGQGKRVLFIFVSIAAIAFIGYLFATSGRQRLYQIILGMLLAGVLGNLYDRWAFGYVRDMIHAVPRWEHLFPWIFNVADSLLCVGVFLMVAHSFFAAPAKPVAREDERGFDVPPARDR